LFREELNLPGDKAAAFGAAVEEVVGQQLKMKNKPFLLRKTFIGWN